MLKRSLRLAAGEPVGYGASEAWLIVAALDPSLLADAKARIDKGSKSFAGAARLFDPKTRASATLLYSWCRYCDDEIDGQELGFNVGPQAQTSIGERLASLEAKTREACQGRATERPFQALAHVVAEHKIPERFPLDLIHGFRMDAEDRAYGTIADTLEYCYHVAGVVGVMMALVMGARRPDTLHRASDLGLAFQLTNIARDVLADARVGRLYLPRAWLAEAGVAPSAEAVADPKSRAGVFAVTCRLLDTADAYYASASYGLRDLPWRSALAVGAARNIYALIGARVRSQGPDGMEQRAVVGRNAKLKGAALAAGQALASRTTRLAFPATPRTGLWTKFDL